MRFATRSSGSALGVGYQEIEFVDRGGIGDHCYYQEIKGNLQVAGEYDRFVELPSRDWESIWW